jgi:hypothetical protein
MPVFGFKAFDIEAKKVKEILLAECHLFSRFFLLHDSSSLLCALVVSPILPEVLPVPLLPLVLVQREMESRHFC